MTRVVRGGAAGAEADRNNERRGEPDGREDGVQCPICDNYFPRYIINLLFIFLSFEKYLRHFSQI